MFVELTREWMGQKAGAVIDLADPDAKILTDGGVAKIVASDPLSPLLTKAMGSMFDGMQKAVDAAINKALSDLQATKTLPRSQAAAKIFGTEGKRDPDRIGVLMQAFTQGLTTGHGKHCESKRHRGLLLAVALADPVAAIRAVDELVALTVTRKIGYQRAGLETLASVLSWPDRLAESTLRAGGFLGDFGEE